MQNWNDLLQGDSSLSNKLIAVIETIRGLKYILPQVCCLIQNTLYFIPAWPYFHSLEFIVSVDLAVIRLTCRANGSMCNSIVNKLTVQFCFSLQGLREFTRVWWGVGRCHRCAFLPEFSPTFCSHKQFSVDLGWKSLPPPARLTKQTCINLGFMAERGY